MLTVSWFIPALLGFIGGVLGSLVAPWVHWAIEKRRSKFEYRRTLLAQWRTEIEGFDWGHEDFGDSTTYASMRPYMRSDVIANFEAQRTFHVPPDGGRGENFQKQWAADEAAKIEADWELV